MGEEIVTTSFVKRMVEEIEDLKKINQQHRTINGELKKEKDDLKKRIEKAIEYIDWQRRNPQYDNVWRNSECEVLIEILKGE